MSQPALDKMIAITDAFDRGAFVGLDKVDTDSIAAVVGFPASTVSRLLRVLNFTCVSERRRVPVRHDRVYEYPPRIRLPDLKRVKQPDARLVLGAISEHRLDRRFTTGVLYTRVGTSLSRGTIGPRGHLPANLHKALMRCGFSSHRPEGFKSKRVVYPATWQQPAEWPALFLEQRRLRRSGLRVSAVYRVTDAAAKLDDVVNRAMKRLDGLRVPYDKRGALKSAIQEIIKDAWTAFISAETTTLHRERVEGSRSTQDVDWAVVAKLTDVHLRNFVQIAARVSASETNDNPGAFALAWVQQNLPSAGTDGALGVNANKDRPTEAIQ